MNIALITLAISQLRPNAEFTQVGETYEGLEWLDKIQSKPSKTEWEKAVAEIAQKEQNKRQAALEKLNTLGITTDDLRILGLA